MKKWTYTIPICLLCLILALTACSGKVALNGDKTGSIGINLIPYTSEEIGISGLAPEGWVEVKPGQFQRNPHSDPTLLGLSALKGVTMDQVVANWQLSETVGNLDSQNLLWELTRTDLDISNWESLTAEVALNESDMFVYLVLLVTPSGEYEALHEKIIQPVLHAYAPMEISTTRSEPDNESIPMQEITPIDTRVRSVDGMTMVYVPVGEFEMGSMGIQWLWNGSLMNGDLDLQLYTDEEPKHTVFLDAFWIDQTEVTVEMFRKFVEATGYETTAEREGWGAPWTDGPMEEEWPHVAGTDWLHPQGPESLAHDDHPVVQVTWEDAAAYCEWAGGQLPTEAQWEMAARGTDGRLWPWGDTYDGNRGSYCDASCPVKRWNHDSYDDGYALTSPVGSFPSGASPYGVLDMAGNVWEWVADWYGENYYGDSPYENPTGPRFGVERTQRGGAWIDNESWVRTTVRHATPPWVRCNDLGFRCALPAE
jgi:formylglycine-generating enzyme required for sulfatase activity